MKLSVSASWKWLKLKTNQSTLTFVISGLTAIVGWTAYQHALPSATIATHDCNVIGSIVKGTVTQDCHTINQAVRDLNGLYQGEIEIGKVQAPIEETAQTFVFHYVRLEPGFNRQKPFWYKDRLLDCKASLAAIPDGAMVSAGISDFRCSIVGISPVEK